MKEVLELESWIKKHVPEQSGKRIIVTGSTSGIGWETARLLAKAGADVVLTARDEAKGRDALRRIRDVVPMAQVSYSTLDLSNLESVRDFASREGNRPLNPDQQCRCDGDHAVDLRKFPSSMASFFRVLFFPLVE
jgi:NAD(P)-dependent dehydrogenase (short-subunit alcohol dehydrogenase family)